MCVCARADGTVWAVSPLFITQFIPLNYSPFQLSPRDLLHPYEFPTAFFYFYILCNYFIHLFLQFSNHKFCRDIAILHLYVALFPCGCGKSDFCIVDRFFQIYLLYFINPILYLFIHYTLN